MEMPRLAIAPGVFGEAPVKSPPGSAKITPTSTACLRYECQRQGRPASAYPEKPQLVS